jgi:hypothetical protein
MPTTITAVDVHDVRFPTAAAGDGSDVINRGDYSATYVELRTDAGDLHEHFVDPVDATGGRYRLPSAPGYSVMMKPASVAEFSFPDGPAWR